MKTLLFMGFVMLITLGSADSTSIEDLENIRYYEEMIEDSEVKINVLESKLEMLKSLDSRDVDNGNVINNIYLTEGMIMKYKASIACYKSNMAE